MTKWNQFGEVISDDAREINIDSNNVEDYDWSKDTYETSE